MPLNPLTGIEEPGDESLQRRRRGLQALMRGEAPRAPLAQGEELPIAAEPLRGGELSRPPELERPAPLSTEAVPRAPAMLQATPLLGGQERLGAALGEAERGEVSAPGVGGVTPGMSGQERRTALMQLFRPQSPEEDQGHEELGFVKQGIGGLKQAAKFTEGPPGSFAMPPATRAAFGAQRAGERLPFPSGGAETAGITSLTGLGNLAIPPSLAGTSAATGFAPFTEAFASSQLGAGTGAGAGAAGAGIAGAAPLLPLFMAPLGIAAAPSGEAGDQARQQAATTAALATAGSIFGPVGTGVGALAGMALPLLGKLSPHRSPEAKLRAELLEAGRLGDTLRGPGAGLMAAQNPEEFFNQGAALGLYSQPEQFAQAALNDPAAIWAASAPGGQWGQESAMGVRQGLLVPSLQALFNQAVPKIRELMAQPGAQESLTRAQAAAIQRAQQAAQAAAIQQKRQALEAAAIQQPQTFG